MSIVVCGSVATCKVVIDGYMGSGKTTLAKRLAKERDLFYALVDDDFTRGIIPEAVEGYEGYVVEGLLASWPFQNDPEVIIIKLRCEQEKRFGRVRQRDGVSHDKALGLILQQEREADEWLRRNAGHMLGDVLDRGRGRFSCEIDTTHKNSQEVFEETCGFLQTLNAVY